MVRPSSSSTSRDDRQLGRLADLDDTAGQVPVLLVGQLAQQHPVVQVAHQHLADRPLAGQERVEQRPEALGLVGGRVGGQPRVDDPVDGLAVDGDAAHDALAPQPGPGRAALALDVVGVDPAPRPGRGPPAPPAPRGGRPRSTGPPTTTAARRRRPRSADDGRLGHAGPSRRACLAGASRSAFSGEREPPVPGDQPRCRNQTVARGGTTMSAYAGWPTWSPSTARDRAEVADARSRCSPRRRC